jgi:hypothetical protein
MFSTVLQHHCNPDLTRLTRGSLKYSGFDAFAMHTMHALGNFPQVGPSNRAASTPMKRPVMIILQLLSQFSQSLLHAGTDVGRVFRCHYFLIGPAIVFPTFIALLFTKHMLWTLRNAFSFCQKHIGQRYPGMWHVLQDLRT